MDTGIRFLPWALAFGLLGTLLTLIWFNQRINRIEASLPNLRANPAGTSVSAPTTTPTPSLPATSEEKTLLDPAISLPKPDFLDRPAAKTLVTPRPMTPARAVKAGRKRKRSELNDSRSGSARANRRSVTKPAALAEPHAGKPGAGPNQKLKSPSRDLPAGSAKP
jgi:hypothetical protein